ncbi:glycosyl transferase [Flavobacterium cyanobacteriorum]|uniref:Glycosyl transferase n=1 Tax=Flavobacterium cyanobacteriorum TaxID=2022802 RepID=A0A255YRN0_9FLAO|nr:glycosyltransferase family 2 protein [Flavobacterium cyanobacteriorum]OYQ31873.1 glycosyl transferase [Flavobacterium cyanobacteriorum]
MNKKVFVVIVTYNGARWIDKNITSLLASSYPVHIIAVDNNSADDSALLLEKYPVDLIKAPENLGFGKANNIGMKRALAQGADYVFLLNQDAWVFEDTVSGLVSKMEADPLIGLLSPLHYSADGITLDGNFAVYYNRKSSEKGTIAFVPFVNAAAWMLSRQCIERTGLFEPLFGHYGEDRNYCGRVRYHNFVIGIDASSKIVHDRVIRRNFGKDIIQSRYKILSTLLDINLSTTAAHILALREVIGLPKYFSRHYGTSKAVSLFFKLFSYYLSCVIKAGAIATARKKAKGNG